MLVFLRLKDPSIDSDERHHCEIDSTRSGYQLDSESKTHSREQQARDASISTQFSRDPSTRLFSQLEG